MAIEKESLDFKILISNSTNTAYEQYMQRVVKKVLCPENIINYGHGIPFCPDIHHI